MSGPVCRLPPECHSAKVGRGWRRKPTKNYEQIGRISSFNVEKSFSCQWDAGTNVGYVGCKVGVPPVMIFWTLIG